MSPFASRDAVERFRALVRRRLGLHFDDGKLDFLSDVLARRCRESHAADPAAYITLLDSAGGAPELRAVADALTVSETYFFRYADHFRAFSETILPQCLAGGRLHILSAGCASGEEPYSLAMLIAECLDPTLGSCDVQIDAVDVSGASLDKARRGIYTSWSLRDTPPATRGRWFRATGAEFALDPRIRAMVTFAERNLIDEDASFWREGAFDVVFCRNVTMYFPAEVTRAVIARIARSLAPGGRLFLGHAETLRGISNDFHLLQKDDAFYYARKSAAESVARVSSPEAPSAPLALDLTAPWVDSIRLASERIAALAAGVAVPDGKVSDCANVTAAVDLMRQERFSEALSALPPGPTHESKFLSAVILTNAGRVKEARAVCAELLRDDELNAGAHYLTAMCCEHDGDIEAAVTHDRTAIYLDPSFAMPHLHWGLMARRRHDAETARRELASAADLLEREDPSRILLFGGGFGREVLAELARTELRAAGGGP